MRIGYVSDERYVALPDVLLEFVNACGDSWEARSRASGSVHVDVPPGEYEITLHKPGFGGKRIPMTLPTNKPHHFRLLSDGLLGYVWPKCVRSGEEGEFRVHSVEPFHLELWRYGWTKEFVTGLGWHDEHPDNGGAVMTIFDTESGGGAAGRTTNLFETRSHWGPITQHRKYMSAAWRSWLMSIHSLTVCA